MEFEKRKAATLASLQSEETDKSPKGTVDVPIIPLLNTLNSHPNYFTTSSCSGRISILSQPPHPKLKTKKKALGGTWLFITHDPADPDSVLNRLFRSESTRKDEQDNQNELVFRFEPLIIAVECKDLASAQSLVSKAIACGFRESGITNSSKRVIIAIRCSIRLEVPLGSSDEIMVSREYVRFLVGVANEKMEANRKRTEAFFLALQSESGGFLGPTPANGGTVADGEAELEARDDNAHSDSGSVEVPGCSLSVVEMAISGEPEENLFLWGHSACALEAKNQNGVLVFGGFGGIGRHGRRNHSWLVDPFSGTVKAINVESSPSPRLGHTSSLVGDCVFVIGGRSDPEKILSDVWVLNTSKNEWKFLECSGDVFPPR